MDEVSFADLKLSRDLWEALGAEAVNGIVTFPRRGERVAVRSAIERARIDSTPDERDVDVARRALRLRAMDKRTEAQLALAQGLAEVGKQLAALGKVDVRLRVANVQEIAGAFVPQPTAAPAPQPASAPAPETKDA